jgi:hypothetical protein
MQVAMSLALVLALVLALAILGYALDKAGPWLPVAGEWVSGAMGAILVVVVILGVVVGGYEALDSVGLISHEEDSVITAQANWFVGESKDCTSYPLSSEAARAMNKTAGNAVYQVRCDDGPEHRVRIRFFGRVEQPEYHYVQWKCTHEEKGFTCYQVSGGAVLHR